MLAFVAALIALAIVPIAEAQCVTGKAVHIIITRGTFEPPGTGLQGLIANNIVNKLPGSTIESTVYPASVDLPSSPNSGIAALTNQTTTYVKQCPNSKVVLMGYSQGAQVTGDVIAGGGTATPNGSKTNPTPPLAASIIKNVVAVIQFGDPGRLVPQSYDKGSCTSNATSYRTGAIAAKFNSYAARIQDYCDAQDPVCCSTGQNILYHLSYFNDANGAAIANFVASKV